MYERISPFAKTIGPQPFAMGQGQPLVDSRPWLGLWIRVLPGAIGANANYRIDHGLRAVPRFAILLDVGTNAGFSNPLRRGSTAWNTQSIFVNMPAVAGGTQIVLGIG